MRYKAYIQNSKLHKDGTYTVFLRVMHRGESVALATGIYVSKRNVTAKGTIKDNAALVAIDALVREYKAREAAMGITDLTATPLRVLVGRMREGRKESPDFYDFADGWMRRNVQLKGLKNYHTAVNSLRAFAGAPLTFEEFTAQLLERYTATLADKPRARTLYLSLLRRLYSEAVRELNDDERGVEVVRFNPFNKIKVPRQTARGGRALEPSAMLRVLMARHVDGQARRNLALDCFKLSFCLMGINSADLYNAATYKNGRVCYGRTKTKDRRADGAYIEVAVPPVARPIFDAHRGRGRVFDFSEHYVDAAAFNKNLNKGLKQLGAELGIDGLQFYQARHTFATLAVNAAGVSKYAVHEMLNHVDPAMRVTDLYVIRDFTAINEENARFCRFMAFLVWLAEATF